MDHRDCQRQSELDTLGTIQSVMVRNITEKKNKNDHYKKKPMENQTN